MQNHCSIVPSMVSLLLTSLLGLVPADNTNCNATESWLIPQTSGVSLPVTAVTLAATILPFTPRERDVQFLLLTSRNPTEPCRLRIGDVNALNSCPFNLNLDLYFIVHGWLNNRNSPMCKTLAAAAIARNNTNVIIVDWGYISMNPNYVYAAKSVGPVGEIVAKFINFLCRNYPAVCYKIKVIGHSLGAHVAGFAGKYIEFGKIHTIFGLDPAGPLFDYCFCEKRLCKTDATYVESMHTNCEFLGLREPIGHSAFYVNGGERQYKCAPDMFGYCSHMQAVAYCEEALKGKKYPSIKCATYTDAIENACGSTLSPELMAWPTNFNISGIFCVNATDEPQYKLGFW
nr:phospholipase A1 [Bactrocera oleae]